MALAYPTTDSLPFSHMHAHTHAWTWARTVTHTSAHRIHDERRKMPLSMTDYQKPDVVLCLNNEADGAVPAI